MDEIQLTTDHPRIAREEFGILVKCHVIEADTPDDRWVDVTFHDGEPRCSGCGDWLND
jgi:hypothetical protein